MLVDKICYTAIIGNYDILRDPSFNLSWKFVCFTDQDIKSDIWQIIKVDKWPNQKKQARNYKIDFSSFLPSASIYLWVDANIQIVGNLDLFCNRYLNSDINLMKHPHRNSITQESKAIIKYRKDDSASIMAQLMYYQSLNFISNELGATGILLRKNSQTCIDHSKEWIEQVNKFSHRDQMSFNFCCWKLQIKPSYFSYQIIDSMFFKYHLHPHKIKK